MEFKKRVIEAMTNGVEIRTNYLDKIEVYSLLYKRPEIFNRLEEGTLRNVLHYGNLALSQVVASTSGGYSLLRKLAAPDESPLVAIQLFDMADITGILVNTSDIINEKDRSTMENVFDNNHLTKNKATRLFLTMTVSLLANVNSLKAIDSLNFFLIKDIDKFYMDNVSENLNKIFEISELPDYSIFEN